MATYGRPVHLAHFDHFSLDLRAGELYKDGLKVKLQDQPLRILQLLLDRPGDIVSREELRNGLWAAETFVDFEGGLNTAVNKLRAALGDTAENPRFVETVGRRGYRFIAPVERPSAVESGPPSLRRTARRGWRRAAAVAGLAIAAAIGVVAWRARAKDEATRASLRSLAVLPLADLSGGAESHLADGMTDALITELAKIRALKVISQTSAMRYKGTQKALPEIARELGVNAIVEGSVLRSGERVRVTAKLIRAGSDEHLWAQDYERSLGDLLSLQREVARAVAAEVRLHLTPDEKALLANARPVAPEARDAYLKGLHNCHQAINQAKVEDALVFFEKSIAFYQEAIRRAPGDAQAHAGLAEVYHWKASTYGFSELFPRAKSEAEQAIRLDGTLAKAHASLAYALLNMDWDWEGAEREYKRTLELDPAAGHHGYALLLAQAGRFPERHRPHPAGRGARPDDPAAPVQCGEHLHQCPEVRPRRAAVPPGPRDLPRGRSSSAHLHRLDPRQPGPIGGWDRGDAEGARQLG